MQNDVKSAIAKLAAGDIIGMPTETVYGLAGRIDRPEAIKKIFISKDRPFFDPLIVHVASIEQAQALVQGWPKAADLLAQKFWPGPLTLVLPQAPSINDMITSGLGTIAIRMPRHPLALELIRASGPLAAPSANRFGRTSPSRVEHVRSEFPDLLVIDGGPCEVGIESTIVAIEGTHIKVLRPGMISIDDLSAAVSAVGCKIERSQRMAPGQLQFHYQPEIPLLALEPGTPDLSASLLSQLKAEFGKDLITRKLQLNANPALAAREIYHLLRDGSGSGADLLYITLPPDTPNWQGLRDRLLKAAAYLAEGSSLTKKVCSSF